MNTESRQELTRRILELQARMDFDYRFSDRDLYAEEVRNYLYDLCAALVAVLGEPP